MRSSHYGYMEIDFTGLESHRFSQSLSITVFDVLVLLDK